jgi:hypothetical protein
VLGYADIFFANCFIPTLKCFPVFKQIMCEFSPKSSHSILSIPDYDIKMKYDYWSSVKSDYGSTSFVESEIIGMESFHKLDIPLIHLKIISEKDDQEEKESDCKINSNSNTEFDFKTIIEPSSIIPLDSNTIRHETNPSTSNINI